MVNQIVLEYLRVNRGNYDLADLKKKILASGHSQKDIDDALIQLNAQSGGNVPTVNATINKINKTNLPLETTQTKFAQVGVGKKQKKSRKSRKWLWISLIIFLILVIAGAAVWYFWDKIVALFA